MSKTIEEKTAQTILQETEEIKVGDKTYTIAPPSVATLILASAAISRLPHLRLDGNKIIEESLNIAKDCAVLGEIAAILILGAKHVNEVVTTRLTQRKRRLWGLFKTTHTIVRTETRKEQLAREVLEEISPRDLHNLVAQILIKMQVGDFFGLTTFLSETNLIRQTKVGPEQTASGQS